MSSPPFIIRSVSEKDGPGVIDLRLRMDDLSVSEKNSLDFWRWENLQNPYGNSIGMLAISDEMIISHMTSLPRRVLLKGCSHSCSHVIEAMTDRRFRKGMAFLSLGLKLDQELKERNVSLLYCFPNSNSRPIFQRGFRWIDVGSSRLWLYPLRPDRILATQTSWFHPVFTLPFALAGRLYKTFFPFKSSSLVVQTTEFDMRFQPLLDQIHNRYPIVMERSLDYLNWRYCKTVGRKYTVLYALEKGSPTVAGYLVYRLTCHEGLDLGVIMDLQVLENDPNWVPAHLLGTALSQIHQKGAHAALCLSMPADPINKSLYRSGFLSLPRPLNPNPFDLMIKLPGSNPLSDFVTNPAHWRLSFGDNDVF
ncbi:MAG TPA: GNAT family N-acetyltransferase [archaeon]|nr:GNAT family N-acetyltransferase [archaeon]